MGDESLKKALALAKTSADIIGIVLDVNSEAKIDIKVKSVAANIATKQWRLSDIHDLKKIKPVVVQGIMTVEDALLAAKSGADAIWVSNEGGRALDTLPSTISVLPAIARAL